MCFTTTAQGHQGRCCLSWFIVSLFFSIVLVGVMAGVQIYTKGPISTYEYEWGSIVLYVEFVISVLSMIYCTYVIINVKRNIILGLIGIAGLGLSFFMTISYTIAFAKYPTAERMSKYLQDSYGNGKFIVPPFLDFVQGVSKKGGSESEANSMGCCGGKSFEDYAKFTKKWKETNSSNGDGYYEFTVPDSCCIKESTGCGKRLIYYFHAIDYEISDEALKQLNHGSRFTEFKNKVVNAIIEKANRTTTPAPDPNVRRTMEEWATRNLKKYVEYTKNKAELKIFTVGCGRTFEDIIYNNYEVSAALLQKGIPIAVKCLIAFAILKIILNILTIAVYIFYYLKFNFLSPNTVAPAPYTEDPPQEQDAPKSGENEGSSQMIPDRKISTRSSNASTPKN